MGSETQLWDETQQSAKLGLTFFQIISLSFAYSSYTSLCCSFYLVLNKTKFSDSMELAVQGGVSVFLQKLFKV